MTDSSLPQNPPDSAKEGGTIDEADINLATNHSAPLRKNPISDNPAVEEDDRCFISEKNDAESQNEGGSGNTGNMGEGGIKKATTFMATDAGISYEHPFPESKKNFVDDHISSCHAEGSSSSRCKSNQGESCRCDDSNEVIASKNPFHKGGKKSSSVLSSLQPDSTNREENNDSDDAFNANNTTTLRFGVTEGDTTGNDNDAGTQQNCTVPKPQSCKTQHKDETDGISEGANAYFDGKDTKELNDRRVLKVDHVKKEKFENTAEDMNTPNISGTAFQEGGNALTRESGEKNHPEIEEQKEKMLSKIDDTTTKIDGRNPVEIDVSGSC